MNADYEYIVARLHNVFASDPRVSQLDIKVMVCHGRIHLHGEVPSEERRKAAEDVVVETIPGVEVRNELTIIDVMEPARAEAIGG